MTSWKVQAEAFPHFTSTTASRRRISHEITFLSESTGKTSLRKLEKRNAMRKTRLRPPQSRENEIKIAVKSNN